MYYGSGIECDWERECWEQKTLWGNHTSTKTDFKLDSAYVRIQEYHSCNENKKLQEGMNVVLEHSERAKEWREY